MTSETLALASGQYTLRILQNFTGDRVTQAVRGIFAGIFTGIFTYWLIVMRTIRGGDEGVFVPSLAITFGVVLAIVGIVTVFFFITSPRRSRHRALLPRWPVGRSRPLTNGLRFGPFFRRRKGGIKKCSRHCRRWGKLCSFRRLGRFHDRVQPEERIHQL
jgi:hypothetical protein